MTNALTHIPLSSMRGVIQDVPRHSVEIYAANGLTRTFQLEESPIYDALPTLVSVNGEITTAFTLDSDTGLLQLSTVPSGTVQVEYFYTQLTNAQLENCINFALQRHNPNETWESIPLKDIPYIQILATSSAFYMLAARWATKTRIRVETTEIAYDKIAERYFLLGKQMEQQYYDASAGIIDIQTVTRRDVFTGRLVPVVGGL